MKSFVLAALLFVSLAQKVEGFVVQLAPAASPRLPHLHSSGGDELDSMRKLLESSWDADTMGQVPSDATIAANEALSSILSASDRGVGIFFVDLLLPAYDVTQGSQLYDEVVAMEYCIALSECLTGKSSILVRDSGTVDTVSRILDAREKEQRKVESESQQRRVELEEEEEEEMDEEDDGDDGDDNEFGSEDDAESQSATMDDDTDEDSDVDATGSQEAPIEASSEVDLFRQQLMSSWDVEPSEQSSADTVDKNENVPSSATKAGSDKVPDAPEPTTKSVEKRYRICSLFGTTKIAEGPDMMDKVVKALRENALPSDDEENLIILSAITREEMVAVRSLAAKYEGDRKIVLVNCKLDPIPKELFGAETVYSILPLLAKAKGSDSQARPSSEASPPKIVVLRRFPGDWQVFVDVGAGFQLAATAPSNMSNKRGPPMEWVGESVQRYLRLKQ